jgi:hypothetical protein
LYDQRMTQPDEARIDNPTPRERDAIEKVAAARYYLAQPARLRSGRWVAVVTSTSGEEFRSQGASREDAVLGAAREAGL